MIGGDNRWNVRHVGGGLWWLGFLIAALLLPGSTVAYTAAGDRLFPATLVIPQIAPGDEFYINTMTLPQTGGPPGAVNRNTGTTGVYTKSITDRLSFTVDETYTKLGRVGAGAQYGWLNFDTELKYLAIDDLAREFVLSLGLDREFGDTGAGRVGASTSGATTPRLYFGKGLGDLDIGNLRPLAVAGFVGFQAADQRPRPNLATGGFVVEYSIPYLQSKVQSYDLPDLIRNLTPMTEVSFTTPVGTSFGARTTMLIAPGVSYAGEGWEFGIEALVPLTRATGRGVGVTAQLHLSLDFLFPDTIGRPLFAAH